MPMYTVILSIDERHPTVEMPARLYVARVGAPDQVEAIEEAKDSARVEGVEGIVDDATVLRGHHHPEPAVHPDQLGNTFCYDEAER